MREQPGHMRRVGSALLLAFTALACFAPSVFASNSHVFDSSFGPDCTEGTTFQAAGPLAVDQGTGDIYVADLEGGAVFRCAADGTPAEFTAGPGAGTNEIGGFSFFTENALFQIAVNSESNDFYVAECETGVIHAFHQSGEPAEFTVGPGAGTNELPVGEPCGVAVDAGGLIYASTFAGEIQIFEPGGEEVTSFSAGESVTNIVVDTNGAVYVTHYVFGGGGLEKFTPSEFPVTATTTYTSAGVVDSDAINALAIDPSNNDLYTVKDFGESVIVQRDEDGDVITEFANTGAGEVIAGEGVAASGGSENVYASDTAGAEQVEIWVPPPPEPPTVESLTAKNITATSADCAPWSTPTRSRPVITSNT